MSLSRPPSPSAGVTHRANIDLCVNLQSKDSDYSHLKVVVVVGVGVCGGGGREGGHGSLDGGCHGFLSKAFGIMAHPLLMSALEDVGGGREVEGKGEEKR